MQDRHLCPDLPCTLSSSLVLHPTLSWSGRRGRTRGRFGFERWNSVRAKHGGSASLNTRWPLSVASAAGAVDVATLSARAAQTPVAGPASGRARHICRAAAHRASEVDIVTNTQCARSRTPGSMPSSPAVRTLSAAGHAPPAFELAGPQALEEAERAKRERDAALLELQRLRQEMNQLKASSLPYINLSGTA